MSNFLKFLEKLALHCGIRLDVEKFKGEDEYELAANILDEINKFLYQKKQLCLLNMSLNFINTGKKTTKRYCLRKSI